MTDEIQLIGQVAKEYFRKQLQSESLDNPDGVARFLLDRLTGEVVTAICLNILQDTQLNSRVQIKVPKTLVEGMGLPDDVVTEFKTTYWRNAECQKDALILANINDDQGTSLRDISTIGAGDLKAVPDIWIETVSRELLITDDQKEYWKQALKGLQEVYECSLEQFSRYVVMTYDVMAREGVPLINALGWALPALRIPRDSVYFEGIPDKAINHVSRWKKKFQDAIIKRACYLVKQNPSRQTYENADLNKMYIEKREQIPSEHHPLIETFIEAVPGWTEASEKLANIEWERDRIHLLFLDIKILKMHLAIRTNRFFDDEYPDMLTEEEKIYLNALEKRKDMTANEEDKDFYERHRQELETDRLLKSEWDKFVFGKSIECDDFYVGLLEAVERLFAQCEYMHGVKTLKIRTTRGNGKKKWLELNEDVGMYFCTTYRGIEKLTNRHVEWETQKLFEFDKLIESKTESKKIHQHLGRHYKLSSK